MNESDNYNKKEVNGMPTAEVMELLEKSLNQKTQFEIIQEDTISYLSDLINSGSLESIEKERKRILKEMQEAGILDKNGDFIDYFDN